MAPTMYHTEYGRAVPYWVPGMYYEIRYQVLLPRQQQHDYLVLKVVIPTRYAKLRVSPAHMRRKRVEGLRY